MKKIFTLIATALFTMSASAQTTIFSAQPTAAWDVPGGSTDVEITADYATISGGKMYVTSQQTDAKAMIKSQGGEIAFQCTNNNTFFKVVLNEALQAGDVISTRMQSRTDTELGLWFATGDRPSEAPTARIDLATAAEQAWTEALSYTVATGDGICGETTFYIYRATGKSTYFNTFAITRAGGSGEGGGGGDTGLEETYSALSETNGLGAAYAAVVDANNIATNVVNGNSIVKFGTANVEVEAVGSADPADKPEGGQDITIGAQISAEEHTYELVSINSTKPIKWEVGNRGDISYYYIKGTGTPAVSMVAEEIYTEGEPTGKYRVKVTAFDPTVGGEPASGLYYKFTTKVDGALKVGIWANKGNRTTFLVDGETKMVSDYIVEGYLEGETDTEGKLKWLTNDEIVAIHDAAGTATYVIGNGKNFWGNAIIDAKAGKTYWLFQGNSQIGFQGYTFVPGAKKEDITKIESIQTKTNNVWNADAPMYNLSGQKVDKSYKGIVIQNGRKFVNK